MTLKQYLLLAALVSVSACAGVTPAGRNAGRAPEAIPAEQSAVPAPPAQAPTPTQAPVASEARIETPPPPPAPRDDDDIVVQGEVNRQLPPPEGDPRSNSERMRDIRAWDQCVTRIQAAGEVDPMRPQLETPEEYCSRALGMADRAAVPLSRSE
jgi:hypothetical protein